MKFVWGITQEQKNDCVRKTILRLSKSLYNACNDAYKLNKCEGCKFNVTHGCTLHGHPIEWKDKFK